MFTCYIYIYIHIHTYTYIYIERERERERDRQDLIHEALGSNSIILLSILIIMIIR